MVKAKVKTGSIPEKERKKGKGGRTQRIAISNGTNESNGKRSFSLEDSVCR